MSDEEIVNGVKFSGSSLIEVVDKNIKSITIPDFVNKLNRDAFHGCTLLEEITFPPKLWAIERSCFDGCISLKKLELPEGISEIDYDIISHCYSLTSLTLPSSLRAIKGHGFRKNYSLKEFNFRGTIEELVEIDALYFWRFENLRGVQCSDGFFPRPDFLCLDSGIDGNNIMAESITIPEGLEEIGSKAFRAYKDLKQISLPSTLHTIGHSAFLECSSLANIELPVYLNIIGACAFQDCKSLTKVLIPDSIQTIGDSAFQGCINLSEITYEGSMEQWKKLNLGTAIAKWTLVSAVKCSNGEIPLDPPYVIDETKKNFSCNYAYREFRIPDEAKVIYVWAFSECTSLQSLTIPDSIEYIAANAFEYACSLSEIIFEGTVEKWNKLILGPRMLQNCPVQQIKCSDGIVNRELYKIEDKVLTECYNLGTSVLEIPEGVEIIKGSRTISSIYITKIILPEGLKEIAADSISDLMFLETVVIPSTIEKIDSTNFGLCQHLKEFIFNGTKEQWHKKDIHEDIKYMMEAKMTFLKS